MKNALLILAIICNGYIFAQTDYRKGKIIKLTGDTLIGELNFQGDIKNSKSIRFRNQEIDTVFNPYGIQSYFFENGKYYTSKIALIGKDTVKIFAEYLVSGKKNLFYTRSASGFHYLINMSDSLLKELPFFIDTVKRNGFLYQKKSNFHVGLLKAYFSDCPSLFQKIERLKEPERKALISLTKEYHDITCGEGACTIYERKEYPFKIAVEPIYSYYLKNIIFEDTSLHVFGGNLYFWLPNSSERLYFKTGMQYAQLLSFNYFQIPLQFEYVSPSKIIKPKFNFGVNLHLINVDTGTYGAEFTGLIGGGCYVRVTNWLYLDFELISDFISFSTKTGLFESFALRTGIYFRLSK